MDKKELGRYIFWEWIEPIGSALGIALLVMKFIMALYVIPTGSMQPTLHGANDYPGHGITDLYGGGDKVLVNKFIYRFNKPERWDVIVFEYPFRILFCNKCESDLDSDFQIGKSEPEVVPENAFCRNHHDRSNFEYIEKDYIKRCVGLPGDELTIEDGNILLKSDFGWRFAKKTKVAQNELWVSEYDLTKDPARFLKDWMWLEGGAKWNEKQNLMHLTKDSVFRLKGRKIYAKGDKGRYQGMENYNLHVMGDLKCLLELNEVPKKGELEIEIKRNGVSHLAVLDFAAKKVQLYVKDTEQPLALVDLAKNNLSQFSFARLDGQLVFSVGEQQTFIDIPGLNSLEVTESIIPSLRYRGRDLKIRNIKVFRDIYYGKSGDFFLKTVKKGVASVKIAKGQYFSMGDNSYHSSDSRAWGPVPEEELIGKALSVILPFGRIKMIY